MKKYLDVIKKSTLFNKIEYNNIQDILNRLFTSKKSYKKGEYIINNGDINSNIGIVLSGKVHIIKEDFWGNKNILSEISESELFGESYACSFSKPINVNAVAIQDCTILLINIGNILNICHYEHSFHIQLIQNLIKVLADKNLMLTNKIEHITQRTIRNKLLSYLSYEAQKQNNFCFDIPFNRQELADYLSVDRSALSNELCKLRNENIIKFNKNHFILLEKYN